MAAAFLRGHRLSSVAQCSAEAECLCSVSVLLGPGWDDVAPAVPLVWWLLAEGQPTAHG